MQGNWLMGRCQVHDGKLTMKKLFLVVPLLLAMQVVASAGISWTPSSGSGSTVAMGKYTSCTVVKVVVGGDVTWEITCTNPNGTQGLLKITPPENSLSTAEADALNDCQRQNDGDNEVTTGGSTSAPTIDRVATGPTA